MLDHTQQNGDKTGSILIVDDSMMNLSVLSGILSPQYTVYTANNGLEGINSAKKYKPDVIILDIVMPDMDGYEVIKILKHDEELQGIPVIFITGLTNTAEEERGLQLGGADYIIKPFSSVIVKLRVENQVRMQGMIREITFMSMNDSLTGLPNRRCFDERLHTEWKRARREKQSIGILLIDIDYFKKFNDFHGHLNGDEALKTVASMIKAALVRPVDIAARWGGEEFIVLLPGADMDGAEEVAKKIRLIVELTSIYLREGGTAKTTVSIGVNARIPTADDHADNFIQHADDALYEAKAQGRNRVCRAG
ncbi:MAG: diguanylate cyclase [Defluviitaleaceae bacterium]|nr:diguanylate cyclase [Defluviitaleaceae bacterium]